MNILVVGAGAVGQVYGRHLAQAGHAVSFFVKAKYANELKRGLPLHRLGRFRTVSETWSDFGVVTDVAEVARGGWDQIWLALSSDALRGELAEQVLRAAGAATVVCLQPDIHDGDRVRARVPADQVVQGMIPFISFQSPLPGRPGPAGMAYVLPPVPTLLAGEASRVKAVMAALRGGGLRGKRVEDFRQATAVNTAFFQSMIATLESNGWDLKGLPGSEALKAGLAAAREAVGAAAPETGASSLPVKPLLSPLVWRLLLPVARRLFPFDLEVYLHYHFSKVGIQTRLMLESYVALGEARGLPVAALRALRARLPEEPVKLG